MKERLPAIAAFSLLVALVAPLRADAGFLGGEGQVVEAITDRAPGKPVLGRIGAL